MNKTQDGADQAKALLAHMERYSVTFDAYRAIVDGQLETLARKSHDYGMDNINLGLDTDDPNNRRVAAQAVIVRMLDKMNRLKQLVLLNNAPLVGDEGVLDTLRDLANYAVIAQLVIDGKWGK
jgi:hypothetical protein